MKTSNVIEKLYKRLDWLGDKLSALELKHEWTEEEQKAYNAYNEEYEDIENNSLNSQYALSLLELHKLTNHLTTNRLIKDQNYD